MPVTKKLWSVAFKIIECKQSNKPLSSAGRDRIHMIMIMKSSRERCDDLHIELQRQLDENPDVTMTCHGSCVSSYTNFTYPKAFEMMW